MDFIEIRIFRALEPRAGDSIGNRQGNVARETGRRPEHLHAGMCEIPGLRAIIVKQIDGRTTADIGERNAIQIADFGLPLVRSNWPVAARPQANYVSGVS